VANQLQSEVLFCIQPLEVRVFLFDIIHYIISQLRGAQNANTAQQVKGTFNEPSMLMRRLNKRERRHPLIFANFIDHYLIYTMHLIEFAYIFHKLNFLHK